MDSQYLYVQGEEVMKDWALPVLILWTPNRDGDLFPQRLFKAKHREAACREPWVPSSEASLSRVIWRCANSKGAKTSCFELQ